MLDKFDFRITPSTNVEDVEEYMRPILNLRHEDSGIEGDDEASEMAIDDDCVLKQSNSESEMELSSPEEEYMQNIGIEAGIEVYGVEANDYDKHIMQFERMSLSNDVERLGNSSDYENERRSAELQPIPTYRPFPDKSYYWMNDYETLNYIKNTFPDDSFYIMHDGKIVENFDEFVEKHLGDDLVKYSFRLRLCGGLLRKRPAAKSEQELLREAHARRRRIQEENQSLIEWMNRIREQVTSVQQTINNLSRNAPRWFPDKPYYWMNDMNTLDYIKKTFKPGSYYIMHNGKIVADFEDFISKNKGEQLVKYSFHLRVRGGKGGFGSLLRSFRVNKSTNKLMMRDLNGRRMASVDEEKRLKAYLERQAKKEQELKEKRKAKLEKLTAGPGKHQFEDQVYLSRREEIIEKTEDACEAGFAYFKELKKKQKKVGQKDDSDDDDEVIDVDELFNERGGRKRKIEGPSIENDKKQLKRDYEVELENQSSDSENDSENEPDAEELEAIREYFNQKENDGKEEEAGECSKDSEEKSNEEGCSGTRKRLDSASNVDDLPKIDDKTPCEYGPVELNDFAGAEDLELLGLEHLKAALTDRGLKCGGTLSERAARLWSIKALSPRQFPKHIMTPELKRKIAEEEEAELKAHKKAKKAKKAANGNS